MSNFSYSQKLSMLMISAPISLVGFSLLDAELPGIPAWLTPKPIRGNVANSK